MPTDMIIAILFFACFTIGCIILALCISVISDVFAEYDLVSRRHRAKNKMMSQQCGENNE